MGVIDLSTRVRSVAGARAAWPRACVAAFAHLGWQAWAGSFRFAADPRNPYVYAHTGTGVFEIARRVEALAAVRIRERLAMPVEVISGENLWPLPWYLRRFSAVRWETAPVNDGVHAPVDPDDAGHGGRSRPASCTSGAGPASASCTCRSSTRAVELRPQVEVRGYAAKTLWDAVPAIGGDPARSDRTSRQ